MATVRDSTEGGIMVLIAATLSLKKVMNFSQVSDVISSKVEGLGLKTELIVLKRMRGLLRLFKTKSDKYLVFASLTTF